jgi:non-lysosomal glucosylceramidase
VVGRDRIRWTVQNGSSGRFDRTTHIGHFAYLEGHEYPMYNTYDVHFSASFALAMNWPELELSLQRDFARALDVEHPETVTYLFSGGHAARKVAGVIPHDLGSPWGDPWRLVNAYDAQDVSRWKDLNPKFVLQVYRDWVLTGDGAFLADMWPAVEKAVGYMLRFDRDGDGLIENDGYPDQTYDVWSARGPSAYTGGLWLACLQAGAELARAVDRADRAHEWDALLARGREAYERLLWNGEYYLYDASGGPHGDSVMADQLAGHWFARACGLPGVVPGEHARSVLRKVFALNVMGWRGGGHGRRGTVGLVERGERGGSGGLGEPGERGAVNGMRPYGFPDRTCMQSAEVWIGTTFSLAAAMLQEGMTDEAFASARGVYLSVYRDFPLWFQTPEAIDVDGAYRSIAYMRPLAVWAMQWELARQTKMLRV